jgi:hypothetical protein
MSAKIFPVGHTERNKKEIFEKRRESVRKVLNAATTKAIIEPLSVIAVGALFGIAAGSFLFFAISGARLAVGW